MQLFPFSSTAAKQGAQLFPGSSRNDAADSQSKGFQGFFSDTLKAAAEGEPGKLIDEKLSGKGLAAIREAVNPFSTSASKAKQGKTDLGSLLVSPEDFSSLKESLKKFGFSKEDIEALGDRISSEGGIPMAEFMSMIHGKAGDIASSALTPEIDAKQETTLQTFFAKLGFTAEQSETLMNDLKSGHGASVWNSVSAKLRSFTPETMPAVETKELQSLADALGLSGESAAKLNRLFANMKSGKLSGESLDMALQSMDKEVAATGDALRERMQELRDVLAGTLREALDRADVERAASRHEDRSVQTGKEKILNNARKEARQEEDGKLAASEISADEDAEEAAARNRVGVNGSSVREKSSSEAGDQFRTAQAGQKGAAAKAGDGFGNGENASDRQMKDNPFNGDTAGTRRDAAHDGKDADRTGNKKEGMEKAWRSFWNRIDAQPGLENRGAMSSGRDATFGSENAAARERILQQVERGMLQNLGQGRHRLSMNLEAPNVGKVLVILQVNAKEVSAVIRTDNHEAAKALTDQMQHLRSTLEQQGLKVEKLDVQTQLQDEAGKDLWDGTDQHNQAREREIFSRNLRHIRMMRGSSDELAREMNNELQNDPKQARIARTGLDLIA